MRILALDTATRATVVALRGNGVALEARDDPAPGERPRHAAALLPLAAELLERAGIGFGDLDRLAVGVGPGTFTGLRIGVASARALARAAMIPLVGVSTLQSLSLNALAFPELATVDSVVAVLDARRGEVFAAAWRRTELETDVGGLAANALIAPAAFAPEALAERLRPLAPGLLAVGEGAVEFRKVLERSGAAVPDGGSALHLVTAANHCVIATHLEPADPDAVDPQYLRLPDAEIARRAAGNT
jgi:tRNA threonylcarbamoyladenosine biosynthesis protein TsaB